MAWAFVVGTSVPPAWSDCQEPDGMMGDGSVYTRQLSDGCTQAEREARAISATEVLQALQQGKGIDFSRVVISGDLLLTDLALVPIHRVKNLSPQIQAFLAERDVTDLRVIGGPWSIRDSVVHGQILTGIKDGYVLVQGPQTMTGTSFEGVQDWSRTIFASTVDWSGAHLVREAFFVQAQFFGAATFSGAQFGPHTRLHRATFHHAASFDRTVFRGLAELLEVTFRQDVSFARAHFEQGTGFSGSRFEQGAVFTGAQFEREVFFLFTQFQQAAHFGGGRFQGPADFADARFLSRADFGGAVFEQTPKWSRVEFQGDRTLPAIDRSRVLNLGILVGAGVTALVLFWIILRR